jgi:integral membrane sensor domain MASE1/DNA invertase Pin-like site-specific DNA recombinase
VNHARAVRTGVQIGLVAASYFAAAKAGLLLATVGAQVTLVWPPTGIALAALLLGGLRLWPGVTIGATLVNLSTGVSLATACGIGIGNTLEAVLAVLLLRRLGFKPSLDRLRDVYALLVLAAGLSTIAAATVGVASLVLSGVQSWHAAPSAWGTWWLGDALGDVVVAPVLLVWATHPRCPLTRRRGAEAALLLAATVAAGLGGFLGWFGTTSSYVHLAYLVFPLLLWATLRFGPPGVVLFTLVVSGLALWGTVHATGLLLASPLLRYNLLNTQLFMGMVGVTGLILAAAVSDREGALTRVRALERADAQATELALREVNRRMEEFLSIASHELRTPLTIIQGNLQLIARRLQRALAQPEASPGDYLATLSGLQQFVQNSTTQAARLGRMMVDLLDVARIQSNHLELHMEAFDLADLVRLGGGTARSSGGAASGPRLDHHPAARAPLSRTPQPRPCGPAACHLSDPRRGGANPMTNRRKRVSYTTALQLPRRAVLYARFSSTMQGDSWSIEAQVADLRAHCARLGWDIHPEVCADKALSGKLDTDERPGRERAMALIRAGDANVLVVHKIDRFFRNVEKTFRYVNELADLGAGVVCTQQPINTLDPMSGKIVLAVMAALAESYLDNLSEETSKGKRARAQAGLPNGDVPYGYQASTGASGQANRTPAVVHPEEAMAVRRAFELYATGQYSDARIAAALNDAGYRMRSKRHPDGYPFTKDTLTAMLDNPFYAGWVTYTGNGSGKRGEDAFRVRGQHEAIIPQDVYERVLAIRAGKRGQGRAGSEAGTRHHREGTLGLFVAAGLARCRCCRERLRVQPSGGNHVLYRDASRERGIACGARKRSIPLDLVDAAVGGYMAGMGLPDDWHAYAVGCLATAAEDAARITAQRAALERRLAWTKRLLLDGDIEQADYRVEKARIEAELAGLVLPTRHEEIEQAAVLLRNLGRLWGEATPAERRTLAVAVFEGIFCDLDAGQVIAVQMKMAFLPLRSAIPETVVCECGSDGIRIRDLRHDRHVQARIAA